MTRRCGLPPPPPSPPPPPPKEGPVNDVHHPDAETNERKPETPPSDKYRSKFPVAWYGKPGWKYYDGSKKGIQNWVPGAPYEEPSDMGVMEIRDTILRKQRNESTSNENDKNEGREGGDTKQKEKKKENFDNKKNSTDVGESSGVKKFISDQWNTEKEKSKKAFSRLAEGLLGKERGASVVAAFEKDDDKDESSNDRRRRRNMGIFDYAFRWRIVRKGANWIADRPFLVFSIYWTALFAYCLIAEFSGYEYVARAVEGVETSSFLTIVQSIPVLSKTFDLFHIAMRVVNRLGIILIIALQVVLFPFVILFLILTYPNRTRALSTVVLSAVLCAYALGELFDGRWKVLDYKSLRDRLVWKGHVVAYTAIIIFVGGFLLPFLIFFSVGSGFPKTLAWITDGMGLPRVTKYMFGGAAIGFVLSFVGRYTSIVRDPLVHRTMKKEQNQVDVDVILPHAEKSRREKKLRDVQSYPFQVASLALGIVIFITVSVLVVLVYPMPFSVVRSRELMARTSRWR